MRTRVDFTFAENFTTLKAKLLFLTGQRITVIMDRIHPLVEEETKKIVRKYLDEAPEVRSLLGYNTDAKISLQAQLGIQNPEPVVEKIISNIIQNIDVYNTLNTRNNELLGTMTISVLGFDLDELLGLSGTSYVSPPSGSTIDWLRWLLFRGSEIQIHGWFVASPENGWKSSDTSRTDGTHMRPRLGAFYRVEPPGFTGTEDDNFITRAIKKAIPEIVGYTTALFQAA